MNIAVIGAGNVGSTLAIAFKKAGHHVIFGVREPAGDFKGKEIADKENLQYFQIPQAAAQAEVIVICAPGNTAHEVAQQLGDVKDKIIIDTMNSAFKKPAHYETSAEAILDNCNATDVAKCFNTTGVENMADPVYNGQRIDMYVAGSSTKAKSIATQLAKDIGFGEVYDFGGNDKFALIEQFALCWINLAIVQKTGRNMAFKLLRR
ncbi:MAG TPA: NAD(P)-binding domain-containing protein [Ferruginibacter sp.]|jgi:hypothetical protein|nr:NAD(P)-binding domain-containing protein [Ferruginibacter sp.]